LVAKCCKICGKYSLAKFANFVFFCIAYAEIATIFGPNMVAISARNIFSAFYKPNFAISGLKISFTGPSDKMSDDVGSDICPMTFSSVLTWK
jgi:hypothetical protein